MRTSSLVFAATFFCLLSYQPASAADSVTLISATGGSLYFDVEGTFFNDSGSFGAIRVEYKPQLSPTWINAGNIDGNPPPRPFTKRVSGVQANTHNVRLRFTTGSGVVYSEVKDVIVTGIGGGGGM